MVDEVHAKSPPSPLAGKLLKTTGYILPPYSALHDANPRQLYFLTLPHMRSTRPRLWAHISGRLAEARGLFFTGTAARPEQRGPPHIN